MIPTELLYLLMALALGAFIYRYFTGRGGMQILRPDYAGLPARGAVVVRQHEVRWSVADDDFFVAAWQLEDGHLVALRVAFDRADEEEPDLGHLENPGSTSAASRPGSAGPRRSTTEPCGPTWRPSSRR